MVHSGTSSSYRSVDWRLILLSLALYLPSASVSMYFIVFVTFFTLPFSDLGMVGLALDLVD